MAVLIVSCTKPEQSDPKKEDSETPVTPVDPGKKDEDPTTKELMIAADGGIFTLDESKIGLGYSVSEGWKTAKVTDNKIVVPIEATKAVAYYPYGTDGKIAAPASQNVEAGKLPAPGLLVSEAADISEKKDQALSLPMHLVGSLVAISVKGEGETVSEIRIESGSDLAGTYSYDIEKAQGSAAASGKVITVAVSGDALAAPVYVSALPVSALITWTVKTDVAVYTFSATSAQTIAEGEVTEIKLNLSQATTVEPVGPVIPPVGDKIGLTYHFTDKPAVTFDKLTQHFTAEGASNKDLGWFIVALDGVDNTDYSATYYKDIYSRAFDATTEAEATWVKAFMGGSNNLYVTCDPNEAEQAREAVLKVYFDETDEYVVVATVRNAEGTEEAISATDPILILNISQDAAGAQPQPGDKQLSYHFFTSPGGFSITNPLAVETGGVSAMYLGYFFVDVNGETAWGGYTTDSWYNTFRFETVGGSWASMYKDGDNQFKLNADANDSGADRSCTINVYYDGTDAVAYMSDGVVLSAGDPIFSLTINQKAASSVSELVYDFYTIDWSTMQQLYFNGGSYPDNPTFEGSAVTAAGGVVHSGGQYRVFIDGAANTNWSGIPFRGEVVDEGGNKVDWATDITVTGGKIYFTLQTNTGAARKMTIRWYADDSGTAYKVVGTYFNASPERSGNGVPAEVKTITSSEPVFELTITQPGA